MPVSAPARERPDPRTSGVLGAAVALGGWVEAAALVAGLGVYALGIGGALATLERRVHGPGRRRGEPGPVFFWKTLAAVPLTQAVYLASLLSATLLRRIDWRGITYEFHGPWNVRLVEYRPYLPAKETVDRTASLI